MFEFLKHKSENNPCGYQRETPLPDLRSFSEQSRAWQARQKEFPQPEQNDVTFSFAALPIINFMADLHIGHPTTDYKRIEDEVNTIDANEHSFVVMLGDLINNMCWNPGQFEEMEQTPQQIGFLRTLLQHLAEGGKLLHHVQGDHDGWLTKGGMDIQQELPAMGVSISNGPTILHVKTDGSQFDVGMAHQLPGFSMYNPTHPQNRALKFGSFHGADAVISGHNHKKGYSIAYSHELGEPKPVHLLALAPYKSEDSWLKKKGFAPQKYDEMGGMAVQFDGKTHDIVVFTDIVKGNT